MFLDKIEKNKNKIAIYLDKNNSILYKETIKSSDYFLKNCKKRGLAILVADNNIESLLGYIALLKSENTIMILDTNIQQEDFNIIIKKYAPSYIYCSKHKVKFILQKNFDLIYNFKNYNLLKNKKSHSYKINGDLKILLSTSGSLGEPKFVKLSSNNLKINTKSIVSYLNLNSSDRTITTMPMSYSYGLSIINTHLFSGASIVLNENGIINNKFWELYKDSSPTNINGVPFFYELLIKIGLKRMGNDNLRFITQAGGKLDLETFRKISNYTNKNKINFYLMYGQTEASPRISFYKVKKDYLKFKTPPIGKPIPGGKILLKDDKNNLINKKYKEGEIYFKGPNIFKGYSTSHKDLIKTKNMKELKTGDIAYRDEKNLFYIVGRKSRFIKPYGHRLNLDFIEEKFLRKSYKVACIGVKDLLYIFSIKKILRIEKIIDLPRNSFKIIYIKNFPLNSNGKISYKDLFKDFL